MKIHQTAIVSPEAKIDPTVEIGPYAFIGPNVQIGANTVVGPHCFIDGHTTIGTDNCIFPHVSIGAPPQDIKFGGEKSYVRIGNGNHIRECVTIHAAQGEGAETVVGDKNMFMAYVHIAHNCTVGNSCIFANLATLAGHVHVGDRAVLGGFTGIHQFCHVGGYVMIGGMSKITKDVPPYVKIDGNPARVIGLNSIGLKRNGVPKESLDAIRLLYKVFYRSNLNVTQAVTELEQRPEAADPFVKDFLSFVRNAKRGVYKRTRESSAEI